MKPLRACSPIRRTSSHARRRKCRNLSRTEGDLAAQRSGLEQGVLVCLGAAGGVLPLLVAPAHEREAPVGGGPQRAQSAPGLGGDLCGVGAHGNRRKATGATWRTLGQRESPKQAKPCDVRNGGEPAPEK